MFGKLSKGLIVSSLLVTSVSYPMYGVKASEKNDGNVDVNLSTLGEEIDYSTSDSIHFKNGEVLKQDIENGEAVFTSTDSQGNEMYEIREYGEGKAEITNLETGEKTYETAKGIEVDINSLPPEVKNQVNMSDGNQFNTLASNNYIYQRTVKMDTNIRATNVSAAAGIIATLTGLWVVGIVTTVATWYYSKNQPHAYWYDVYAKKKITATQSEMRKQSVFYQTHLYRNHLGTGTQYYMVYNDR